MKELDWLYGLQKFGIKLGLDNIRKLLEKLDNPQKNIKFIHVAGTNGKGSVSAMVASILQKAGYTVGLFTSPHLVRFNERIQINGKEITDHQLAKIIKKIKPFVEELKCTFFETTTALAILHFQKCDWAVMEVGMGGRLDATNVISPEISVITNISEDHKEHLGSGIKKIAAEKAGIIKKNTPVITASTGSALKVIKYAAKRKNAPLTTVRKKAKTILPGKFQEKNAGLASEVAKHLGINKKHIDNGLMSVKWPGRLDSRNGLILDGAHNPAAAKEIKKEFSNQKVILVFSTLEDKDYEEMAHILEPIADQVIVTKINLNRAADPNKIAQKFKKSKTITSVQEALNYAQKIRCKRKILIIGSLYLVGEVLAIIE